MKAATIRDVAAHSGVSVASVSRVLNGNGPVTDATRQRVLKAVDLLGYVPHSGARSLSTSRTDTVGVILPDLFGEFFSELIRGLDLAARGHGLHLIVSSSHGDAEEASAAIRSMRGRVDGLIVLSPHLNDFGLTATAGRMPVLMMNGGAVGDLPSIAVDNRGGAMAAVQHLVEVGRRNIAHVSGPAGNLEAEARLAGYSEAVAAAGLSPQVTDGDFTQAAGYEAVVALFSRSDRPDALFVANDTMAIGALLALQDLGLRCPEDVAVVGFDDVPVAALVRPGLTTLRVDIAGVGRRALDRLVGLIRDPQAPGAVANETVRPFLVVRGSSRIDASTPTTTGSGIAPAGATALGKT